MPIIGGIVQNHCDFQKERIGSRSITSITAEINRPENRLVRDEIRSGGALMATPASWPEGNKKVIEGG